MRETLSFAKEYGASKADQILFGRITAKSGLVIHPTDKVPGGRAALKAGKKTDKATVKLKADYKTDSVFSQASVNRAFREVEAYDRAFAKIEAIAEELTLNEKDNIEKRQKQPLFLLTRLFFSAIIEQ